MSFLSRGRVELPYYFSRCVMVASLSIPLSNTFSSLPSPPVFSDASPFVPYCPSAYLPPSSPFPHLSLVRCLPESAVQRLCCVPNKARLSAALQSLQVTWYRHIAAVCGPRDASVVQPCVDKRFAYSVCAYLIRNWDAAVARSPVVENSEQ